MKAAWYWRVALYLAATVVVLVSVFPFVYAVSTSFKTGSALFETTLWPKSFSLGNYISLFTLAEQPFGRHIVNSIMVSVLVVCISLFIGVTASFALGRINFKGRGLLLTAVLAVSMFPQVAVLAGMFELIRFLGLYNKALGLVLPYMIFTLPFTVWVLTTFMKQLPKELEEAAIMDGCGPWRIIKDVFMPLLWPALVSTGLLAFIAAWNEFMFALTFVLDNDERTVPVSISLISGASKYDIPWGNIMAASVLVTHSPAGSRAGVPEKDRFRFDRRCGQGLSPLTFFFLFHDTESTQQRLVARRRDLPDLPALLPGQQRRRHRRPAGHHAAAGPHRGAGCRRHLALAVLQEPDERLRLRRQRLLRRGPDVRHAGRLQGAGRACPRPRPQGHDRPGALALQRPAPLVCREPRQPRQPQGRLVRLGRRAGRRHAAQQLALHLRRQRLALGHAPLPVLPAQLPDQPAQT